jgi:hypothetical protein
MERNHRKRNYAMCTVTMQKAPFHPYLLAEQTSLVID